MLITDIPEETIRDTQRFSDALIELLGKRGVLSASNADRARRAHERASGSIVDVIVRLGLCAERDVADATAAITSFPLLRGEHFPERAPSVPISNPLFLREAKVVPVAAEEHGIVVAAADPTGVYLQHALELAFARPISYVIAAGSDIEDAILRYYGDLHAPSTEAESVSVTALDITRTDFNRLQEAASEAPIIRFVERLIARAIGKKASDIHIEPLERILRIRMRVDGVLRDEEPAALSMAPAIVSRIKILARLDIAERRLPQDGAIKMNVLGREIDLRVATGPVSHGESVVVRLLDRSNVELDLGRLGFDERVLAQLTALFSRPSGIVLVTGPTGSGKSTTLYAGLKRLNTAERKIITIEDPVEYKIEGLNQFQVKPDIGFDFERALRSILRHDPDVIMVGEIRDGETARIAMQAALTGHLVFSTLHTNDAASAVTRLLDMGVEEYLVASTVTGVLAQRLVRVLCVSCRQEGEAPFPVSLTGKPGVVSADTRTYQATGCARCEGTGYRGRTVISELLAVNTDIRHSILRREEAGMIRAIGVQAGMEPLYDNGIRRVLDGTTTFDEIVRVAQDVG